MKIYNHSSTDLYFEPACTIYDPELISAGFRKDVWSLKTCLNSNFGRIYTHKSCSRYSFQTIIYSNREEWEGLGVTTGLDTKASLDRRDPTEFSVVVRDTSESAYLGG